jgi:hypothetical protein
MDGTAGSKSCDSKPAMRLRRASTSLLSAAVLGAPCTVEGIVPAPASCCRVAVLNLSPRVGSSSSSARWDLHMHTNGLQQNTWLHSILQLLIHLQRFR